MTKNLKLNIKNTQIAKAINLGKLKEKLNKKKEGEAPEEELSSKKAAPTKAPIKDKKGEKEFPAQPKEETPRVRARSRSAFNEKGEDIHTVAKSEYLPEESIEEEHPEEITEGQPTPKKGRTKGSKKKEEESEEPAPVASIEEVEAKLFKTEVSSQVEASPTIQESESLKVESPTVNTPSTNVSETKPSIVQKAHD